MLTVGGPIAHGDWTWWFSLLLAFYCTCVCRESRGCEPTPASLEVVLSPDTAGFRKSAMWRSNSSRYARAEVPLPKPCELRLPRCERRWS